MAIKDIRRISTVRVSHLVDDQPTMTAPNLNIPSSDATVTVQVFNTADPEQTRVLAGTLMTPIPPGREYFHFPIYAFLIENPRLGHRVMFDLGGRDLTTYPAGLQDLLDRLDSTIHADEVTEQAASS